MDVGYYNKIFIFLGLNLSAWLTAENVSVVRVRDIACMAVFEWLKAHNRCEIFTLVNSVLKYALPVEYRVNPVSDFSNPPAYDRRGVVGKDKGVCVCVCVCGGVLLLQWSQTGWKCPSPTGCQMWPVEGAEVFCFLCFAWIKFIMYWQDQYIISVNSIKQAIIIKRCSKWTIP